MGQSPTEEELDAMFSAADRSDDGRIDFEGSQPARRRPPHWRDFRIFDDRARQSAFALAQGSFRRIGCRRRRAHHSVSAEARFASAFKGKSQMSENGGCGKKHSNSLKHPFLYSVRMCFFVIEMSIKFTASSNIAFTSQSSKILKISANFAAHFASTIES